MFKHVLKSFLKPIRHERYPPLEDVYDSLGGYPLMILRIFEISLVDHPWDDHRLSLETVKRRVPFMSYWFQKAFQYVFEHPEHVQNTYLTIRYRWDTVLEE